RPLLHQTATTDLSTLSLHDALPIYGELRGARREPARRTGAPPDQAGQESRRQCGQQDPCAAERCARDPAEALDEGGRAERLLAQDRKSTRLNSSHVAISYAVFCLKK